MSELSTDFGDLSAIGQTHVSRPTAVKLPRPAKYSREIWTATINLFCALALLPLLLIVGLVLVICNPVANRGPLLFRQERLGLHGRPFHILKFRTMEPASDASSTTSLRDNECRITRLGKYLRKYRLDELPNIINVMIGDMDVIGPRPDARVEAEYYLASVMHYADRLQVKPGITGLAQVLHGYADCAAQTRIKARYDRFYVRHRSVALDLKIIGRTCHVMLTGFGSR